MSSRGEGVKGTRARRTRWNPLLYLTVLRVMGNAGRHLVDKGRLREGSCDIVSRLEAVVSSGEGEGREGSTVDG